MAKTTPNTARDGDLKLAVALTTNATIPKTVSMPKTKTEITPFKWDSFVPKK